MRFFFSVIILLSLLISAGQDTTFTILVKPLMQDPKQYPFRFDTVYLTSENQVIKTYADISVDNSKFKLKDVPIGKYRLKFVAPNYCIVPLTVVICNGCEKVYSFSSFAYPTSNCNIYSLVEVYPTYIGGYKALSKDFQKNISEKELNQVQLAPSFTIQFFVTKQGSISDISIISDNLSDEIKKIIIKGLINTDKWNPAIRNGQTEDDIFFLDKQLLLKYLDKSI